MCTMQMGRRRMMTSSHKIRTVSYLDEKGIIIQDFHFSSNPRPIIFFSLFYWHQTFLKLYHWPKIPSTSWTRRPDSRHGCWPAPPSPQKQPFFLKALGLSQLKFFRKKFRVCLMGQAKKQGKSDNPCKLFESFLPCFPHLRFEKQVFLTGATYGKKHCLNYCSFVDVVKLPLPRLLQRFLKERVMLFISQGHNLLHLW